MMEEMGDKLDQQLLQAFRPVAFGSIESEERRIRVLAPTAKSRMTSRHHPSIFRSSAFATFSSVERGISSTKRISRGTLKSASALRQAAITVSCRSGRRAVDAGLRNDEDDRHLVQHRMLLRHHRGLAHAGHHRDHLLDLGSRDVLAADLQHVLGAVAELDEAVLQQRDAVAGDETAVLVEALAGRLLVVQIFREQRQARECP